MAFKLNLTRDQLAAFLKDHESVKQFEKLFSTVDFLNNVVIDGINIVSGNAAGAANDALSQVWTLSQVLDLLATAPRAELGTIAAQNADRVDITGGQISGLNPPLPVPSGGTGQSSYTDGQLLIGSTAGNTLIKALLTAGANITITNGAGSISIAVSGLGTMAFKDIGVSGSFTAGANTVTVTDGIITSIV